MTAFLLLEYRGVVSTTLNTDLIPAPIVFHRSSFRILLQTTRIVVQLGEKSAEA